MLTSNCYFSIRFLIPSSLEILQAKCIGVVNPSFKRTYIVHTAWLGKSQIIAFEFLLTAKVKDFSRSSQAGFVINQRRLNVCCDFFILLIKISAFWESPYIIAVSRGVLPSLFSKNNICGF